MADAKKRIADDPVPAEAKELIAENKRTRDKFLDLSSCELTRVPGDVGELVWLESLDLSGSRSVTDLSLLAGLSALQTLNVSSTRVSDLRPLAGLSALQLLTVYGTQVSDLSPLAGLSALQALLLWSTQVSDLSPLAGLSTLQRLWVTDTQVSDLTPLASLSALQELYAHAGRRPDAPGRPFGPAEAACLHHAGQ